MNALKSTRIVPVTARIGYILRGNSRLLPRRKVRPIITERREINGNQRQNARFAPAPADAQSGFRERRRGGAGAARAGPVRGQGLIPSMGRAKMAASAAFQGFHESPRK
jgi:hypothetical protein